MRFPSSPNTSNPEDRAPLSREYTYIDRPKLRKAGREEGPPQEKHQSCRFEDHARGAPLGIRGKAFLSFEREGEPLSSWAYIDRLQEDTQRCRFDDHAMGTHPSFRGHVTPFTAVEPPYFTEPSVACYTTCVATPSHLVSAECTLKAVVVRITRGGLLRAFEV